MSMFTRNENVSDPNSGEGARQRETMPASVTADAKRPQATVQTLSNASGPRTPGVSVISNAVKITGQLESTEDIQIDGEIEGDVRGVSVTVGNGAKIKGTVFGDAVELAGTIDGKIEAKSVLLTSTARMSGDVVHQDIKIESGAFIDGHCRPGVSRSENKPANLLTKSRATVTELAPQVKASENKGQ